MPCPKLLEYLTQNNVDFKLHEHPNAYAAQDVAFKAGTHTEVLTLPFWEFERLVEPRIGYFTFRRLQEKKNMA